MIQLAMATGIAPSVWADEDDRTIVTAVEILDEMHDRAKGR